ncbi:mitochondrial ribosomal large subunit component [Tulasnella sp. JGI-2019a]|nr:mitochondrial ribosomal large subunit component [Tulasnella sp. JGI-2019a]
MSLLAAFRRCSLTGAASSHHILSSSINRQARTAMKFAPTYVRHPRVHKGRVPIPTGGSIKGTTLNHGDYGIRIRGDGMRITAKQLQAAETVIKRKLKVIKGAKIWMRVFPDMPVCVKGNETRMGKGKGSFEYWACWVPTGRVLFEIAGEPGGAELRPEMAREALRLAADKLPVTVDFIDQSTSHRLGNLDIPRPPEMAGKSSINGGLTTPVEGQPRYIVGGVRNLRVLGVAKPPSSTTTTVHV